MNITRGPIKTAVKMLVYGPEGVGKTTFAAQAPGAAFIDTEGGTRHMDVARFDPPASLDDVVEILSWVLGNPDKVGTIVIDTMDWLERLIFAQVCKEKQITNIEEIGYGKGYVYAKQKLQGILDLLDQIIARGIHVILVCHSTIRKFELPDEMGSYDRYMLKLNEKNLAPLVKEWVDMMLFVNYRTDIVTDSDGKTKKGKGGQKRIMYANHNACWDAKNRFGLPDEMPFEFERIANLFGEVQPADATKQVTVTAEPSGKVPPAKKPAKKEKPEKITERPDYLRSENPEKDAALEKLWQLMQKDDIDDATVIQAVVAEKEYYDLTTPIRDYDIDFIEGCLIEAWPAVSKLAQSKILDLPF